MTTTTRCRLAVFLTLALASAAWSAPPAPGKRGRTTPPPNSVSRLNVARALAGTTGVPRLHSAGRARDARGRDAGALEKQPDFLQLVALRVEFPNLAFGESPPADELHDRFFYEVWFEHVREYFSVASKGRAEVNVLVADAVATAAHDQEYYGDFAHYDSLMIELASEVVASFDPIVDFSLFDGIILLHAGPGQESDLNGDSPLQIWSGYLDAMVFEEQLSTEDSTFTGIPTADGTEIRDVIILPEWQVQDLPPGGGTRLGHIGVYVHEIAQKFGMIPLFDADPSPFPDSQGIGNFGVMGYGLWVANGFIPTLPGAFNRSLLGWVDPIEVPESGIVELRDYEQGPPGAVVARIPISEREYFLVSYIVEDPDGPQDLPCDSVPRRYFNFNDANGDCRFNFEDMNADSVLSPGDLIDTYGGAEWDFFMTDLGNPPTFGEGWGLLVVHVDEWVLADMLDRNRNVQNDPERKAVDVEEADGIQDLDRFADNVRAFGSGDDYFRLGGILGPSTNPDTRSTNGAPTGIEIELLELPDMAPSGVDPSVLVPGTRARVRVRRTPGVTAPQRSARRVVRGALGTDLVTLPLGAPANFDALVVPVDSGRVHLLAPDLDEAPLSDGDPSTLVPWVTLPAAEAGAWIGAATGDTDDDGVFEVFVTAQADSMGVAVTRLFGWRADGTGAGAGGDPLVASLPGAGTPPLVFDFDGQPGDEVVFGAYGSSGLLVFGLPFDTVPCPNAAAQAEPVAGPADRVLLGGPIAVAWSFAGCGNGVAWVEADTLEQRVELRYATTGCCLVPTRVTLPGAALQPVHMAAGDLDGGGVDVVLVGDAAGALFEARPLGAALQARRLATLPDALVSPLALADLDGDGTREIVGASKDAMHVLSFSGATRTGWPYRFAVDPRLAVEPAPARDSATPVVADLDGDGSMEILLHLRAGPGLVWDARGQRRRDLEAVLGAVEGISSRAADLDGDGAVEVASLGRFDRLLRFDPVTRERSTETRTEINLWRWPASGDVAWSGRGGSSARSFHASDPLDVVVRPNATALPSFMVVPNPARDALRARVELTAPARVSCALYTLEGELVHRASRDGRAGEVVEFVFDVRSVASGIYLARMSLSTGGTRLRTVAVRR